MSEYQPTPYQQQTTSSRKPRMGAAVAFPSFAVTLVAFILLLLVTLSVPIIKSIHLFKITLNADNSLLASLSPSGQVTTGVLGYCSSGLSIVTTNAISNWLGTKTVGPAGCTESTLGYNIPESLFNAIDTIPGVDLNGLERSLIKKLTYALVVFPVAAGFAAFVLLLTFLAWCTRSRGFEICAFIVSWLAAGVAWLAFILGIVAFSIAKSRLGDATDNVIQGHLGNGLWMSLAAAILLTFTICLTCCGMCGPYRKNKKSEKHKSIESAAVAPSGNDPHQQQPKRFSSMAEKRQDMLEANRQDAAPVMTHSQEPGLQQPFLDGVHHQNPTTTSPVVGSDPHTRF